MFNRLYIVRVFKKSKLLFVFVLSFIMFQTYFFKKREFSFPWFVWDMYSRPEQFPDTITQTEFYINNKRLNIYALPIWQEATLLHTFYLYNLQLENKYNDPFDALVKHRVNPVFPAAYPFVSNKLNNHEEEVKQYPEWLKNYLQSRLSIKINTIELKAQRYKYEASNNSFEQLNNRTICKFEY